MKTFLKGNFTKSRKTNKLQRIFVLQVVKFRADNMDNCDKDIKIIKTDSGNTVTIRNETESDYRAVENLVRESFWNVYCPGCREHFVLKKMREDKNFIRQLDFVMEIDGEPIGQIVYVASEVDCGNGKKSPVLTFGPISIAPSFKRKGYGKMLLDYSLDKAKEYGASAVFITGNIDFYGKSGFVPAKSKGIIYADDPDAEYFLVKELEEGFLERNKGVYRDPECYFVSEKYSEEFEKYEKTFPEKTKLKLPGQLFD